MLNSKKENLWKNVRKNLLMGAMAFSVLSVPIAGSLVHSPIQSEAVSSSVKNKIVIFSKMYNVTKKNSTPDKLTRYTISEKTGKFVRSSVKPENIEGEAVVGSLNDYYIVDAGVYSPSKKEILYQTFFVKKSEAELKKTTFVRNIVYKKNQKVSLVKGEIPVYVKVKEGYVALNSFNVKNTTKATVISHDETSLLVKIKLDKSVKGYGGKEVYILDNFIKY